MHCSLLATKQLLRLEHYTQKDGVRKSPFMAPIAVYTSTPSLRSEALDVKEIAFLHDNYIDIFRFRLRFCVDRRAHHRIKPPCDLSDTPKIQVDTTLAG